MSGFGRTWSRGAWGSNTEPCARPAPARPREDVGTLLQEQRTRGEAAWAEEMGSREGFAVAVNFCFYFE